MQNIQCLYNVIYIFYNFCIYFFLKIEEKKLKTPLFKRSDKIDEIFCNDDLSLVLRIERYELQSNDTLHGANFRNDRLNYLD